MKNKGFTLVEILAVIVILAVLIVIAVPNVIGISNRIRQNMFCSKVSDIESAAKLYGQDYIDEIEASANQTKTIKVSDLVQNNLYKKENDKCVLNDANNPCVTDPRDQSMMDNKTIVVSKKNKRITAVYSDKSSCDN